jgi:hypothetical protein
VPIYSQLLGVALDEGTESDEGLTIGGALATLLMHRGRLRGVRGGEPDSSGGTLNALSNELDYDIALIKLCRRLDIQSDVHSFDPPHRERSRLEKSLADYGIRLDELESEGVNDDGHP